IVTDLEERPADLVRALELALLLGGVGDHRAELQHPELALAETDAPVPVEDRTGRRELDREPDRKPEREPENGDENADGEVDPALAQPVGAGERGWPQLEQRHGL